MITRTLRTFFFAERATLRASPYAAVAAAGLALGLSVATLDLAQRLDWTLYDRFVRVSTRAPAPPRDIVVVAVDEPSFSQIGLRWPWPRSLHATLVDSLARAGARTIVFDLLFDTPSDPAADEELARAIRKAGNVVLASDRTVVADRAYAVQQWVEPIPELARAAADVAAVGLEFDPDGVLRRTPLVVGDRPTLALAAARRVPGFIAPSDASRARLIHFAGPPRQGIVTVSYYQALDAGHLLPPDMFRGKTVLVGQSLAAAASAGQMADRFVTAASVQMAGVEVHANLVDTLLRHRAVLDPFGTYGWFAILCLATGSLTALALYRLGPTTGFVLAVLVAAGWLAAGYVLLAEANLRLPVVALVALDSAVYTTTAAYRFALVQRERRLIKRAFQHYVAPAIVQQMLGDPSRLKLGGEQYEVTILFSDLEAFTTIAERLTPQQVQTQLSRYFSGMMDQLLAERATLDKFIGDAIMVYFGCPIPDPAHAAQACRGALAMQRRMRELNAEWRREGRPELRTRIGINTGLVVAGNLGTDSIFNFTVLGDCVNLASRLEEVNKEYGTLILAAEDTWARVKDGIEGREIDRIRVKGKTTPVSIYELVAARGELASPRRELHEQYASGLDLYRRGEWDRAAAALRAALEQDPSDGPSATILKRCIEYAGCPPAGTWDGVHVMHTK